MISISNESFLVKATKIGWAITINNTEKIHPNIRNKIKIVPISTPKDKVVTPNAFFCSNKTFVTFISIISPIIYFF